MREFISVFRHGLSAADAEGRRDFFGLGHHHPRFAGDCDELETFRDATPRLRSIGDVNACCELVLLRGLQDV